MALTRFGTGPLPVFAVGMHPGTPVRITLLQGFGPEHNPSLTHRMDLGPVPAWYPKDRAGSGSRPGANVEVRGCYTGIESTCDIADEKRLHQWKRAQSA